MANLPRIPQSSPLGGVLYNGGTATLKGGSLGTQLTAHAARRKGQPRLAELEPHSAVLASFQIFFAAANTPQNLPAFQMQPGQSAQLVARKGSAVNAGDLRLSNFYEGLAGGYQVLGPGDAVTPTVDNLAELWAQGAIGDGLLIVITGPSVG
jgi:hypothetical protein